MRCLLLLCACFIAGCASIKQVDLKTAVGSEVRNHPGEPSDHRFSAVAGPQVVFDNGLKTSVVYRHRITDFDDDSLEHGVFVGATIPLWKKK